jgi:hypothetical protein
VGRTKWRIGCPSATLQKGHNHFVPTGGDSPTQKFHRKDRCLRGTEAVCFAMCPRRRASSQASTGSRPVTSLYQAGWNVQAQAWLMTKPTPNQGCMARASCPPNRSELAKQPRQVNAETREQGEEKEDADRPTQDPGVNGMAKQFALVDLGLSDAVEGLSPWSSKRTTALGIGSLLLRQASGCGRRGPTVT